MHGAIYRFEGQLTLFDAAHGTACYRCLFSEPPPLGSVASCAEAGVFGVLPGIVGSLMAFETIKHILNIGEPLVGRMTTYDALSGEVSELRLYRDPNCPACGENAHPENLPTYADVCAL